MYQIGLVNVEFFREDLNGFGGFGSLCKYLAERYNTTENSKLKFKMFLMYPHEERRLIAHSTAVIPLPPKSTLISWAEYKKRLKNEDIDIFLSIEFYPNYLYALLSRADVPVIIWLQDPRSIDDWKRIATSKFIYMAESGGMEINRLDMMVKKSYQVLKRIRQNNIVFATQAHFLVKKGYEKYGILEEMEVPFLPNPIDIPTKVKFSEKNVKPAILFLGRLDPIKRPWIFFEIAKRLPQYEFWVVGRPSNDKLIENRIRPYTNLKNLKFLGLVHGSEKDIILRKSWILVNTSIHEALPVSFLEALAYKIPIVSCQNPDKLVSQFGEYVGEVLGEGYDSVDLFVDKLRNLVEDENLRKKLGYRGRKYVIRNHTFEKFEKTLIQILTTCGLESQIPY